MARAVRGIRLRRQLLHSGQQVARFIVCVWLESWRARANLLQSPPQWETSWPKWPIARCSGANLKLVRASELDLERHTEASGIWRRLRPIVLCVHCARRESIGQREKEKASSSGSTAIAKQAASGHFGRKISPTRRPISRSTSTQPFLSVWLDYYQNASDASVNPETGSKGTLFHLRPANVWLARE